MAERRVRDMLRHKRVLIAVRLVFFIMISSLALPDFLKGSITPVLPAVLAAYFLTNLAMAFERSQAFFSQRVQACLLLFDIATLVVATAYMERYRQDLFLAMFLVVLLASAGQRLTVSIGGFVAIAACYAWFSLQGKQGASFHESLNTLITGLPVLLVVAIYVGYVTENVAKERRRREKAEEQLTRELKGMSRLQALGAGNVEQDPASVLGAIAEAACGLLDAPRAVVFWRRREEVDLHHARSRDFPAEVAERWAAEADSPAVKAFDVPGVARLSPEAPHPWLAALDADELLLTALADRVDGTRATLLVAWERPHEHLRAEEEAMQVLAQQAGLILENASLYRLLSQTRDLWQSAFQSIPTPVVILDAGSRVVQANPAFLTLGAFDLATMIGSSIWELLEGASTSDGRPLKEDPTGGRLTIPRLNGEFEVTRGPYAGTERAGGGTVWVLRKIPADAPTSSATP
ncbi:MAG TPA: PAS domain-containing protein [Planctomycetota bacterium]